MMRSVWPARLTPLAAAAFLLTAIAVLAFLSTGGDEAEAGTTTTIEVSNFKFCTPGQSPCPDTPLDTTVAAGVGNTISFQLVSGFHTASHCTDDTFTDCSNNLFDFGTGDGDWLIPPGENDSNVYFRCNVHPFMQGLIVVGNPVSPTAPPSPSPSPTASPTPFSVGGIADFPDIDELPTDAAGSSGSSSLTLAALVSGLMVALAMFAAGAWYARRRWLQTQ